MLGALVAFWWVALGFRCNSSGWQQLWQQWRQGSVSSQGGRLSGQNRYGGPVLGDAVTEVMELFMAMLLRYLTHGVNVLVVNLLSRHPSTKGRCQQRFATLLSVALAPGGGVSDRAFLCLPWPLWLGGSGLLCAGGASTTDVSHCSGRAVRSRAPVRSRSSGVCGGPAASVRCSSVCSALAGFARLGLLSWPGRGVPRVSRGACALAAGTAACGVCALGAGKASTTDVDHRLAVGGWGLERVRFRSCLGSWLPRLVFCAQVLL